MVNWQSGTMDNICKMENGNGQNRPIIVPRRFPSHFAARCTARLSWALAGGGQFGSVGVHSALHLRCAVPLPPPFAVLQTFCDSADALNPHAAFQAFGSQPHCADRRLDVRTLE